MIKILRIIEDKNLCDKRGVDGCYFQESQVIVVADKNDKGVLVHELCHHWFSMGSRPFLDFVLDLCNILGVTFFDVVDIESVSEQCFDYDEFVDEILAYFCEEVYKEFPLFFEDNILFKGFLR